MNSTRRGAPVPVAPVLTMLMILLKIAEGLPPLKAPKPVPGIVVYWMVEKVESRGPEI
jgi:hypothetical protein